MQSMQCRWLLYGSRQPPWLVWGRPRLQGRPCGLRFSKVETESLIVDIQGGRVSPLTGPWLTRSRGSDRSDYAKPNILICQTEFPNLPALLQQFSSGQWKIEFQDWIVNTENEINLRASPGGRQHNIFNLPHCISNQWGNYPAGFLFSLFIRDYPVQFYHRIFGAVKYLQQVKEKNSPPKDRIK